MKTVEKVFPKQDSFKYYIVDDIVLWYEKGSYSKPFIQERELDAKKKKKEIIYESKMVNGNNNEFWWDELVDDIGIEELDKFVDALEELKKRVNMRVNESSMIKGSPLPSTSTMNQAINYCASVVPFDFN
ncbi:hypothetical protein BC332_15323 [Capsicum chinense]|nr:hypothetical protein BC332_15323 [Capsicum chinense]